MRCLNGWKLKFASGGYQYQQEYKRGIPQYDLKQIGLADRTGTTITFAPDPEIFEDLDLL